MDKLGNWAKEAFGTLDVPYPPDVIATRVFTAAVFGFLAALVFRFTLARHRPDVRSLPTTLVLLAALIALVTMVIGDALARAFGLVGALSIVRFRTAVDDTADTAFVIFGVVLGMAIGSGYTVLAIVGLPVVSLAAVVMAWWDRPRHSLIYTLRLRVGLGLDPSVLAKPVLDKFAASIRLQTIETTSKGACVEADFRLVLADQESLIPLLQSLSTIEGVQGVELKSAQRNS